MKDTDSEVQGTGDFALFALLKQKSLHPSSLQYVMKSGEQKSLHCTCNCQFIIILFAITVFYCTHREELMIEIECLTYSSQRECSCSPMYMIYDVWI